MMFWNPEDDPLEGKESSVWAQRTVAWWKNGRFAQDFRKNAHATTPDFRQRFCPFLKTRLFSFSFLKRRFSAFVKIIRKKSTQKHLPVKTCAPNMQDCRGYFVSLLGKREYFSA